MKTLLLQMLIGGLFCAIASALLAPLYGNDPAEVAVVGFFVGAIAQVALFLLFMWAGWLR
jgi:hypothetical protein